MVITIIFDNYNFVLIALKKELKITSVIFIKSNFRIRIIVCGRKLANKREEGRRSY